MSRWLLVHYNNKTKKFYNTEFSNSFTKSEVINWFKENYIEHPSMSSDEPVIINLIRL